MLSINSNAASFFTDQGSVQVGGGLNFSSGKYEGSQYRTNTFTLSPLINFFPIPYFLLGPAIDFSIWGVEGSSSLSLGIGGRVGFAYGKNIPVVSFFWVSPQFLFSSYNTENDNYDNVSTGFGMEITGGIMIPVQKHFSVNFGPGFWFQIVEDNGYTNFHFNISVTGLIF